MTTASVSPPVAITFDCTPLRTVRSISVPLDASPAYRSRLERLQQAVSRHGTRNTYYLTNGSCTFQFTNDPTQGSTVMYVAMNVGQPQPPDSRRRMAKVDRHWNASAK